MQILDLQSSELDWLSRHLGHTISTHKDFYRQHEAVVEITKVSKLLMCAEAGNISNYKGQGLEDISVEGMIQLFKLLLHVHR